LGAVYRFLGRIFKISTNGTSYTLYERPRPYNSAAFLSWLFSLVFTEASVRAPLETGVGSHLPSGSGLCQSQPEALVNLYYVVGHALNLLLGIHRDRASSETGHFTLWADHLGLSVPVHLVVATT
jgi:hypothetical protein